VAALTVSRALQHQGWDRAASCWRQGHLRSGAAKDPQAHPLRMPRLRAHMVSVVNPRLLLCDSLLYTRPRRCAPAGSPSASPRTLAPGRKRRRRIGSSCSGSGTARRNEPAGPRTAICQVAKRTRRTTGNAPARLEALVQYLTSDSDNEHLDSAEGKRSIKLINQRAYIARVPGRAEGCSALSAAQLLPLSIISVAVPRRRNIIGAAPTQRQKTGGPERGPGGIGEPTQAR